MTEEKQTKQPVDPDDLPVPADPESLVSRPDLMAQEPPPDPEITQEEPPPDPNPR